jgi:hypothetical protein
VRGDTGGRQAVLGGALGDEIRDDLGLRYLEMPFRAENVAKGFDLSEMLRGDRTLSRVGVGPVAAARDATLSLVRLVPLSHYLQWPLSDLMRSFLNPAGQPLLRHGRYASRS